MRFFTTFEKLEEVERMLDVGRAERRIVGSPEHRQGEILKAIAEDLRARIEGVPSIALVELERRITAVARKNRDVGAVIGVGEELIARWPVVKQSLERVVAGGFDDDRMAAAAKEIEYRVGGGVDPHDIVARIVTVLAREGVDA